MAQNAPMLMSAKDRVKATMEKMEVLKLDAVTKKKAKTLMTIFYNDQQTEMEELRSSGNIWTAKQ